MSFFSGLCHFIGNVAKTQNTLRDEISLRIRLNVSDFALTKSFDLDLGSVNTLISQADLVLCLISLSVSWFCRDVYQCCITFNMNAFALKST